MSEVVEHEPTHKVVTERTVVFRGELTDNAVNLRGRVSSLPTERELPSGTRIATFRLSVPRARTTMTAGSKQGTDWVECTAWTSRARRAVAGWAVGDEVEVGGALRRRFYPNGLTKGTRLEVEVVSARRARPRDPEGPDAGAS